MKHYKAIAAMSLNRVIGRGNQIPWRLPEDFRWFKQMTTGRVVVMGRRTFESLPGPLPNRQTIVLTRDPRRFIEAYAGRLGASPVPWPRRRRRQEADREESASLRRRLRCVAGELAPEEHATFGKLGTTAGLPAGTRLFVCGSLDEVDPACFTTDVFICGGAGLYQQALPRCSDLYLTLVKREVEGDTFLPVFEDRFELSATVRQTPEFDILHYRNRDVCR
jgi:dihydrofolate reductase